MSKRLFIAIAVLMILTVGGISGYFVLSGKLKSGGGSERSVSLFPKTSKKEASKVTADVSYEDSSGFSFKYPKDIKVTDVTPDGDNYYTQLNLTKGAEKVVITIKDTSAKSTDDWLKGDSTYSGASLVGAATLGGVSAKQYSKEKTSITVAIDQGVVYLIEGPKDGGFWEDVQGAVVSSFKFSGTATSVGSDTSGTSDIQYEEEEVIE